MSNEHGISIGHIEGMVRVEIDATELSNHRIEVEGDHTSASTDTYITDPDEAREIADEIRRQADQAERWHVEEEDG